MLSTKLNHLRLDRDLNNPAGFTFVADVINAGDKFTKGAGSFRGINFHDLKRRLEDRISIMGYSPHRKEDALLVAFHFQV